LDFSTNRLRHEGEDMLKNKLLMVGVLVVVALFITSLIAFNGNGQSNQIGGTPPTKAALAQAAKQLDDDARPIVDFNDRNNVDPNEKAARKLKNARYDKHGAVYSQPNPSSGEVVWEPEWWVGLTDLPVEKSDLLIEGIVERSRAFLSEDKTGVYSEFTIKVSNVLRTTGDLAVNLGDDVVIERFGGKVRYPNGQVVLYRIEGQGAPMVGKRYLFFLAKAGQGNYKLLTAYEIQGKSVFPLDGSRINFRGKGKWAFDKHDNEDLDSFRSKLQQVLSNSPDGGLKP
jgi:hypothetical protein